MSLKVSVGNTKKLIAELKQVEIKRRDLESQLRDTFYNCPESLKTGHLAGYHKSLIGENERCEVCGYSRALLMALLVVSPHENDILNAINEY